MTNIENYSLKSTTVQKLTMKLFYLILYFKNKYLCFSNKNDKTVSKISMLGYI
jgi:hypothetical protein